MMQEFSVVIEKDEDGYFVATVPALRGCHTQARSEELLARRVDVVRLRERMNPRLKQRILREARYV